MKFRLLPTWGVALLVSLSACGHEFHPPDQSERIAEAEEAYAPALFDSISWASDSIRAFEGNVVYAEMCTRCHGPLGRGATAYSRERGLEIPSLVEADWPLANLDTLRHAIFVGHEGGMPIYGSNGITLREIDGSAYYILNLLRPDAMAEEGG